MRNFLIAAAVLCCWCVVVVNVMAIPESGDDLEITVEGVNSDTGKVMVALHSESNVDGFPDVNGAIAAQWVKASQGTHRFVFLDLQPGKYAVAVFHDENENGKLDTNILGIPSEGIGFSRNAHGNFGPPGFYDAAVEITSDSGTTRTATKLEY